ncbi:MAG: TIR domain-containing protein [Actinobacteria bacterium]|nr:TIR domain-containing protein [Actinomycetota bacterium]
MTKPTIFISYSHNDEEWKDRLVTQLGVLQQHDFLDIWVDTRIEGGADWYQEIKRAIEATSITVLLISADFLNSKFITEQEVPMLLQQRQEKGLRIFPIILKPCDWPGVPWLANNLARPKDGRPLSAGNEYQIETDLVAIAREIRELLQRAGLPRERQEYVALPPEQVSLAKLPTTHHALFGRDKELKLLDDAWANPHCHVLCFVAFGGVGKTALVNEWLNLLAQDNYRGAERVYGWSFYSQGTREDKQASADTFFEDALQFFGYTGEPIPSAWDRGKKLAELIRERKTLLILDGLEPLQYPPGEMEGRLRDPGLQTLLKELARFNNGLCLITTRCQVADIEPTVGKTTQLIELENLSSEAGMQVLREAGVSKGTDKELQQAAKEYGYHALALTLLGRYLAIRYGGEIRKRDTIQKLAFENDRQGAHARHVMDSYENWLKGTGELELLYLMGLFDRPAPLGAIAALKQPLVIKGVTDRLQRLSDEEWDFALGRLRDLRLLSVSDTDKLDCHPLIREHFGEKLKARSEQRKAKGKNPWQEAHSRLYEYYKNLPQKLYGKELPDTLEEMEPLFAAVAHCCQAGRYQEAYEEVYRVRILRGNEFFGIQKLGAIGSCLATLASFFNFQWHQISDKLTDRNRGAILNEAGFHLQALGRLAEAVQATQASLRTFISQEDWQRASIAASNISELYMILGHISQALEYGQQSLESADRSRDARARIICRSALADALHQAGRFGEAYFIFREAENIQKERQPEMSVLYIWWGYRYCTLLIESGKYKEVMRRAYLTLKFKKESFYSILDIALDHLSLAWANLLQSLQDGQNNFTIVKTYLNNALDGLQRAGTQHELPRGLFARAFYYRVQNQFRQAWDDLEEAREIAERGEMKLWLADYHLEAARIVNCQLRIDNCELFENGRGVWC